MTKSQKARIAGIAALLAGVAASGALAQAPTLAFRQLAPEAALRIAQEALNACRKSGFQTSVAVVDRAGILQVLLRDRYAGPHSVRISVNKAWTAASFRTSTQELARATQPGQAMSGLRNQPRVAAIGGGLPIEAGGQLLGGIGVSGAPGGEADEHCARAGIESMRVELELQ